MAGINSVDEAKYRKSGLDCNWGLAGDQENWVMASSRVPDAMTQVQFYR
ncbi:hypothetical protein [Spirosoma pulveris]